MKKLRSAALAMAAVLSVASFVGCNRKSVSDTNSSPSNYAEQTTVPVGQNKINAAIGQSVTANDTVFTLNSVISPENMEDEGKRYVYFDITINNNSASAYSLSTLNNFYIVMNDGTEIYSDVRTQLFAMSRFVDNSYFNDPFDIPANSQFKGIVGGFLVDKDAESFSVGFYPTKDIPTAKGDVILIEVKAENITAPDASILKPVEQ